MDKVYASGVGGYNNEHFFISTLSPMFLFIYPIVASTLILVFKTQESLASYGHIVIVERYQDI